MQLFRAQLSRYTPHPHRDSWMRNNLDNWLYLLRLCSCLTLMAAGFLTLFFGSPLGTALALDEHLVTWLGKVEKNSQDVAQYILYGISGFLIISGVLCFRCGQKKKPKYTIPVIISTLIIGASILLLLMQHSLDHTLAIPYLLPFIAPLTLLFYRQWENKLDHWTYWLSTVIAFTLLGFSWQALSSSSYEGSTSLKALHQIGLNTGLASTVIYIVSITAIAASLLLFVATTRRLALFIIITLGGLTLLVPLIANISSDQAYFGAHHWTLDTFFHISYIMLPTLILLSLASRRKTQTLRL